jgi:hypothetical protein
MLLMNGGHFLGVGGDPKRAARHVLAISRKLRRKVIPELTRPFGECELRVGVIEHEEMPHAGRGCAAADRSVIEDEDALARFRKGASAGGADDAGAQDRHVKRLHPRMPH